MRSTKRFVSATMMTGLALLAAFTWTREPAAVLVKVSGAVEVQKVTDEKVPGTVGLSLEPGDRVLVPSGGKAVLMYRTGKMETAAAAVTVAEPASGEPAGLYAQTARTITQVATTDAARQPNRQGMIRPVQGTATGIAPRNGIAVDETRPTFTWYGVPGTTAYTIMLRRTDAPGQPVRFQAGADTVWTYPADAQALERGGTYSWVVGTDAGRIGQQMEFRVLDAERYAAIQAAMDAMSASGLDPAEDGLFVAAVVYRDAGLVYDAAAALERLAAEGTGGRLLHLMRGEALDAIGDLEGAAQAFQAADRAGRR